MLTLVSVIALLLLALVVVTGVVLFALADMLLRPPRMTDGKAMYVLRRMSPGDLGLAFEPIEFTSRVANDPPLTLTAWWIAAASLSDRTCILIHGFGDAKVGALAWAHTWRDLGWNLLLIDLRAHGESGGRFCTGGFFERDDLDAIIDSIRLRYPAATTHIALFGVSLGGAVALATAARRDDLAAVVADSVFADYRRAAIVHGRLIGAPLLSLVPLAVRFAEWRAGVRFDEVRPIDTVARARCPVLLIHGDADPFVPPQDVIALSAALKGRRDQNCDDHWIVPEVGHCLAIVPDPPAYARRIDQFLSRDRIQ